MIHGLPNLLRHDPELLRHARLDRRLYRGVERGYGRDLDARVRRHADRHRPVKRVSSEFSEFVDARVGPRGSLENLSQEEIDKLLDTGQSGLYPLFRTLRAGGAQLRGAHRQRQGNLRPLPRLRHPHRAPPLRGEARDAERTGDRLRRRADDPRHQGAPVRGAARRGVHLRRDHRERALRSHRFRFDHQRGLPRPAQRAPARLQGAPQPGGVLGRALDRRCRVPVHQEGRATSSGLRGLDVCTGCGPGRHEGADEGRRPSATPSSASRTAATSA